MDKLIKRVKRDIKDYPESKISQLLKIKNIIPKIYKPINSLKQISTIYNDRKYFCINLTYMNLKIDYVCNRIIKKYL